MSVTWSNHLSQANAPLSPKWQLFSPQVDLFTLRGLHESPVGALINKHKFSSSVLDLGVGPGGEPGVDNQVALRASSDEKHRRIG